MLYKSKHNCPTEEVKIIKEKRKKRREHFLKKAFAVFFQTHEGSFPIAYVSRAVLAGATSPSSAQESRCHLRLGQEQHRTGDMTVAYAFHTFWTHLFLLV